MTDVSNLDDLAAKIASGKYPNIAAYANAQAAATQSQELDIQALKEAVDVLRGSGPPRVDPPVVGSISQTITEGATLTGTVTWNAVYDGDNDGVEDDPGAVRFYVDGALVLEEFDPPFGDSVGFWNSTSVTNGSHTFRVEAWDAGGTMVASNQVTATVTNSLTASLFDGRATRITSMRGCTYGTTTGAFMNPLPHVYTGDYNTYYQDDFTLISDVRFGQVFRVRLNQSSRNPFWVGQPSTKPSCEITERRPITLGQVDWYALSIKWTSGWTAGAWGVDVQLGYPTLASPPLAVAISKVGGVARIGVDRHAGTVTSGTTGLLNTEPRWYDLSAVQDKWVDWVIGVKWTIDNTGWVQVQNRVDLGAWVTNYDVTNTPTWQVQSGQPPKTTVMDKIGAYQDASGFPGTWQNVLHNSGLTRWADETSAKASLG